MPNNNTLFISVESRRREANRKSLSELKKIAKALDKEGNKIKNKKPLLNVDQYTNATKHILVERILKGPQLEDDSKDVLLKFAQDTVGLKVNASMSKTDLIEKIRKRDLKDLNNERLKILARENGVVLKSKMTDKAIIERLNDPSNHQTTQSLLDVAENKKNSCT